MLLAIDDNNNRISPSKGKIGFCQLCKMKVRAYCGEINIDHWRHFEIENCDTWNEGETEWHREWKNEFPKSWQEIIIENDYGKHIADIQTPNGVVLELQNSSISSSTIRVRENFYGNMLWLINANKFKDNFKLGSVVSYHLRHLSDSHYVSKNYPTKDSVNLKKAKGELETIESKLRFIGYDITSINGKIRDTNSLLNNFKSTKRKFINSEYYPSHIVGEFKIPEIEKLHQIKSNAKELKKELPIKKNILLFINNLKNCELNGYNDYKYINPRDVNSSSYSKCALTEKESESSLFPTIIFFNSEKDFEHTSKNEKFRLIVNTTEKYLKTEKEIELIIQNIETLKQEKLIAKSAIKTKLKKFLRSKKKDFEAEIIEKENEKEELNKVIVSKITEISEIQEMDNIIREKKIKAVEQKLEQDRYEVMKKYKGLYTFTWKHKRKSWDYSEKKIFLDFGNAIFEIKNGNSLRKHTKAKFIELVKNQW